MYANVDPCRACASALASDDLQEHLERIEAYNTRAEIAHALEGGNLQLPRLAGQNVRNQAGQCRGALRAHNLNEDLDYILRSVQAGLNVLADKPMAVTPADFEESSNRPSPSPKPNTFCFTTS